MGLLDCLASFLAGPLPPPPRHPPATPAAPATPSTPPLCSTASAWRAHLALADARAAAPLDSPPDEPKPAPCRKLSYSAPRRRRCVEIVLCNQYLASTWDNARNLVLCNLCFSYLTLFTVMSQLASENAANIKVMYDLFNISIAFPVNAAHLFQLYARRGEAPHIFYSLVCMLLASIYLFSFIVDITTLLELGDWPEELAPRNSEWLSAFALHDGLATWTWSSTGYLFHQLHREGQVPML
ncbi:hypothetical protein AB1Y20_016242 [Prymnesium parvum]|uniref:Uncharacterized protein n=1 Tax=Prymnesium parvum TaxID=97485 RepID=A0AB34IFD7_PRYPA